MPQKEDANSYFLEFGLDVDKAKELAETWNTVLSLRHNSMADLAVTFMKYWRTLAEFGPPQDGPADATEVWRRPVGNDVRVSRFQFTPTGSTLFSNLGELLEVAKGKMSDVGCDAVWFHGTTEFDAHNIITNGIQTDSSYLPHDFGYRRAFYVSDQLEFALIRAITRALRSSQEGRPRPAVIAIHLDFEEAELELLDLRGPNCAAQWKDVVNKSRTGQRFARDFARDDPIPFDKNAVVGPIAVADVGLGWQPDPCGAQQLAFAQREVTATSQGLVDTGVIKTINEKADIKVIVFALTGVV